MTFFKYSGESIIVDVPILELYIPYSYYESGLYQLIGEDVQVYGILNFRTFMREQDIAIRNTKPIYPLCISAFIRTKAYNRDIDEIILQPDTTDVEKCIILTYYKGDTFIINKNIIKSADNNKILINLFESGKLVNIPYELISDIIIDSQSINNLSYGLPDEDIEVMVAEKSRNPKNVAMKARFMDKKPTKVVAVNPRVESNLTSTYSGFVFEDVNTSLIVASNRKKKNIEEEESIMEKLIKGKKIK